LSDPFLIDECLSPDLVAVAHARGRAATHVLLRGLQGTDDRRLIPLIRQEGLVLVTSNGRDFLRLYRQAQVHPGLVIIVPDNIRGRVQAELFGKALDVLATMPDLVNKVMEVQATGEVAVRDWPPP
jgi:predicted nuclease of predicted toxin-antitoxin system